jgi:hypothetical protein
MHLGDGFHPLKVLSHLLAQNFWVGLGAERREADHIGEKDADQPALFRHARILCRTPRPAGPLFPNPFVCTVTGI